MSRANFKAFEAPQPTSAFRPLLLCQMLIEGHKAAAAKSSRAAAAPLLLDDEQRLGRGRRGEAGEGRCHNKTEGGMSEWGERAAVCRASLYTTMGCSTCRLIHQVILHCDDSCTCTYAYVCRNTSAEHCAGSAFNCFPSLCVRGVIKGEPVCHRGTKTKKGETAQKLLHAHIVWRWLKANRSTRF